MNTYVQIEGYGTQWFRLLKKGEKYDQQQREKNIEKMKRKTALDSFHQHRDNKDGLGDYRAADFQFRMQMFLQAYIGEKNDLFNYEEFAQKHGAILIREIGSYMLLKGNKIVNTKVQNYFPTETADIVICENDESCEPFWEEYLRKTYPNKSIITLNHFSTRSVEEIKENLKGVSLITFSTTLGDTQWFENLLEANESNLPIVGYFHVQGKDKVAKELAENKGQNLTVIETI